MRKSVYLSAALIMALACDAHAAGTFMVQPTWQSDEKPVYATVESLNIIPARIRTGGTITALTVHEGDQITAGQVIALSTDRRLAEQTSALDAQIEALSAQAAQAKAELDRNVPLFNNGVISRTQMDALQTAATVAASSLKARTSERKALGEQIVQGQVIAPANGRILTVPAAIGTVMMPGEVVATIARQDMVVRVKIPERHAQSLTVGQTIRLEGIDLPNQGTVSLIYPQIAQGMVQADIKLPAVKGYYVGQRVQAWIPTEKRPAFIIPAMYVTLRYGLDFVRIQQADGHEIEVTVQRGSALPLPDGTPGMEILSGVQSGDTLVQP